MATGRMIQRKISSNKELPRLIALLEERMGQPHGAMAALLYTWSIAHLDIDGRMHGDPFVVKGAVLPRISFVTPELVEKYLLAMAEVGLVSYYEADGDRWLEFSGFKDCQPGLRPEKERPSSIPSSLSGVALNGGLCPEKGGKKAGSGRSLPGTIEDQSEVKEKSKSKDIRPASASPTLAFSVDQALGFLAEGGRFTATPADSGQSINLTKLIKKHPDPGDWRLVGQWLAAGGDGFRGTLDTRAAGDFKHWLPHARKWDANGRGPVAKTNGKQGSFGYTKPRDAVKETKDVPL
jgi:hypothetical protein